jgi:peptidoglycan hydrolase CwlO-like protein
MNIMKLIIDNIFTILIILLICMCFFVQTYFEIEHLTTEEQVEENTEDINKLGAKGQLSALQSQITSLKADLTDTNQKITNNHSKFKVLNNDYTSNKKKIEKAMKTSQPPAKN